MSIVISVCASKWILTIPAKYQKFSFNKFTNWMTLVWSGLVWPSLACRSCRSCRSCQLDKTWRLIAAVSSCSVCGPVVPGYLPELVWCITRHCSYCPIVHLTYWGCWYINWLPWSSIMLRHPAACIMIILVSTTLNMLKLGGENYWF